MNLNETSIFYIAIAFLLGLIIKSYLPSYMSKKGENLATKEDIEGITKKIESVKATMEIQRDSHLDHMKDRKDALLSFYDEVTTFQYELMAVNFGDFPFDEGKSLYEYQVRFYKAIAVITMRFQRLVIYLEPNSELLKFANNLTTSVIECRKVVKENFGKIKATSVDEELRFLAIEREGKQGYILAVEEANKANTIYWEAMKPHMNTFTKNYQSYLTALNKELQERKIKT